MYLAGQSVILRQPSSSDLDPPSRRVVLQVLALALQHPTSYLDGRRVIFAREHNVRCLADGISGIHHLTVIRGELIPFMVFGHGKGPFFEFVGRVIRVVGFTAKDPGENGVCLLDFSHDDRLELATGCFQVQVGLDGWVLEAGRPYHSGHHLPCANSSPRLFVSRLACRRPS